MYKVYTTIGININNYRKPQVTKSILDQHFFAIGNSCDYNAITQ